MSYVRYTLKRKKFPISEQDPVKFRIMAQGTALNSKTGTLDCTCIVADKFAGKKKSVI
jgi:hypothetical protein